MPSTSSRDVVSGSCMRSRPPARCTAPHRWSPVVGGATTPAAGGLWTPAPNTPRNSAPLDPGRVRRSGDPRSAGVPVQAGRRSGVLFFSLLETDGIASGDDLDCRRSLSIVSEARSRISRDSAIFVLFASAVCLAADMSAPTERRSMSSNRRATTTGAIPKRRRRQSSVAENAVTDREMR